MTAFSPLYDSAQQYAMELQGVITRAGVWAPRSQQIAIGPSELGHECSRYLAYKTLDWEQPNKQSSGSWPAQMGTAIHSYLEHIFKQVPGAKTEWRVNIRQGLGGTIDLYDEDEGGIVDWKTAGVTSMKKYRSEGGTARQWVQQDTYGLGVENTGKPINWVALAFIPTAGSISDMLFIRKPWDRDNALRALQRIDTLVMLLAILDVENNPKMWEHIPAAPDKNCGWCPFYKPFSTDLAIGCPGDTWA